MNYLKNILSILLGFTFAIMTACSESQDNRKRHSWTEQEKKDFECKCSQTDTFNNVTVHFRGFESNEFDSVLIKEYKDDTPLDSFKIFVSPSESPSEKKNKERDGNIERTMHIKNKYQFIIPGLRPYELSDMKMVVWAMWTEVSEGYGCMMGDFTLDGVKFQHVGNPKIIKR